MLDKVEKKQFVLAGVPGSGKTTALQAIVELVRAGRLNAIPIAADELYKDNPYLRESLENPTDKKIQLKTELWFLRARVAMVEQILSGNNSSCPAVIDGGLVNSGGYANKNLQHAPGELKAYEKELFTHLRNSHKPEVIAHFQIPLAVALQRIAARAKEDKSRAFELTYYSPSFLESLCQGIELIIKRLEQEEGVRVIAIDSTKLDLRRSDEVWAVLGMLGLT